MEIKGAYICRTSIRDQIEATEHPASHGESLKKASVFLLLASPDSDPYILAIVKADSKDYPWANQVALPGGHVDRSDRSPKDTAYRELFEEMNIEASHVDFLGAMGSFLTINNTEIQAFVGVWDEVCQVRFDPSEIARVVHLPIETLAAVHGEKGFSGRAPDISELLYPVGDVTVWGATARILHHFMELLLVGEVAEESENSNDCHITAQAE